MTTNSTQSFVPNLDVNIGEAFCTSGTSPTTVHLVGPGQVGQAFLRQLPAAFRLVGVTDDHYPESGKHYITLWMEGDWLSGEGEIASPREADEVGWFSADDLPQPLFTSLANYRSTSALWRSATHDGPEEEGAHET